VLTAMRFVATEIPGAFIIALDAQCDERGFFARTFCEEAFAAAGIHMHALQANLSYNARARTLRGLHYQTPYEEPKLVQCVRGQVWDVALDLRPSSPAYGQSVGVNLSPEARQLFFIPPGCAHGFLTLTDDADLLYLMGAPFIPGGARGVRWNDPAFRITWPAEPAILSARDAGYPDFVHATIPEAPHAE
jgi:dTDP-4-dehydrorhamnose 3,5-epimerase